jgi:hypothetical protein
MPNLHLTDIAVRALKPSEGYVTFWDDTTPGFGVRVGKRSKTWTVILWEDDGQITDLRTTKHFDKSNPRVEVTVRSCPS